MEWEEIFTWFFSLFEIIETVWQHICYKNLDYIIAFTECIYLALRHIYYLFIYNICI
jgi:hypothetical protein